MPGFSWREGDLSTKGDAEMREDEAREMGKRTGLVLS
jgi:hypothetical protein